MHLSLRFCYKPWYSSVFQPLTLHQRALALVAFLRQHQIETEKENRKSENNQLYTHMAEERFRSRESTDWASSYIVARKQAGGSQVYCSTKQVTFPRLCSVMYIVLFQTTLARDPRPD